MAPEPRMHRKYLKSKEARGLVAEAEEKLGTRLQPDSIEEEELPEDVWLYFVRGKPELLRIQGRLVPSLLNNEGLQLLPSVTVDMGAIPYVCNGADVMAPGIRRVDGVFEKDAVIVVRDERHGKALAIGITLLSSDEMKETRKGKTVENMHFVGDKLWEAYKMGSDK